MVTIFFYVFLFVFWVENVLGLKLTNIKGVSFSNIVVYVLLIIWALQLAKNKKIFVPHPSSLYLAFFLATVIVSTIIMVILTGEVPSVNLTRALISIKSWANPLILFFIFYNIIPDEKVCHGFIVGLLLFLVVTVLTMLLGTYGYLGSGWLLHSATGRASGFGNPNDYASFLVLFTPLILVKFFLTNNSTWRFVGLGTLLLLSLGLIATGSRGGMLGLLFALVVFFLLLRREIKFQVPMIVLMITGCCLLLILSFFIAPQHVKEDVQDRFIIENNQGIDEYSAGRISNWSNTVKLFVKRPIVGHGHKSMKRQAYKYFQSHNVGHNFYLSYLAQYGLVGFVLFLTALMKILNYVKCSYLTSVDLKNNLLYISYLSGVAGFLLCLIFANGSTSHYFFWIFTAVMSKMSYLNLSSYINKNDFLTCR